MEALMELVAASFARHGIECPTPDSPAVARSHSYLGPAVSQATGPAEPPLNALPEHNYIRSPWPAPTP